MVGQGEVLDLSKVWYGADRHLEAVCEEGYWLIWC